MLHRGLHSRCIARMLQSVRVVQLLGESSIDDPLNTYDHSDHGRPKM